MQQQPLPEYACVDPLTDVYTRYKNKCFAECNQNTVVFDYHCGPACVPSAMPSPLYCEGLDVCVSGAGLDAGFCNYPWTCEKNNYGNNCFPDEQMYACYYRDVNNIGLQCNRYEVSDPLNPSMVHLCSQCEEVTTISTTAATTTTDCTDSCGVGVSVGGDCHNNEGICRHDDPLVCPSCVTTQTTAAATTTSDPCANAPCSVQYVGHSCPNHPGICTLDTLGCPYCDTAAATTTADPCASQCDLSGSGCYNTDERKYGVCIENLPACNVCHVSDPTTTANAATTTSASTTFDPCSNACTEGALCNSDQGICRDGTSAIPPTCNYCEHCANACTLDHPCMNGLGTCKDGSYPNSCPYCDTTQTTAAATTTADPCDGSCYGVAVGYHCPNMGVCRQDDPSVCPQCVTTQTTAAATTTADTITTTTDPCANSCAENTHCLYTDPVTNTNTYGQCVSQNPGCPVCDPCPCPVGDVCYDAFQNDGVCTHDPLSGSVCPICVVTVSTTAAATTTSDSCTTSCVDPCFEGNHPGTCVPVDPVHPNCLYCEITVATTGAATTTTDPCVGQCDLGGTGCYNKDEGKYGTCQNLHPNIPDACNECVVSITTTTADVTTTADAVTTTTDPCDGSCYGVAVGYHCPNTMGVCRQDDPSVCPQCVTTQTTAAATTTADAATTGCTNECQSTPNYDSCTTANTGYECEQGADGCSTCVPKATTTSAATTYTTTTAVDTTSAATTNCDQCEVTPNGCYVTGTNHLGICEPGTDGCKVCVPRTQTTQTVDTTAGTTSCDECDISGSTVTCTKNNVYGHCETHAGCNRCVTTYTTTTADAVTTKTDDATTTARVDTTKTDDATTTESADTTKTDDATTTARVDTTKTDDATTTEGADTTKTDDATTTEGADTTRTDDATTTEGADTTRTDDATTTKDADTTQYIIISDSDTTTNSGTTTTDSGTTSSTDAVNTQSKACRYDVGVAVVFVMALLSWT
eukprot:311724_1